MRSTSSRGASGAAISSVQNWLKATSAARFVLWSRSAWLAAHSSSPSAMRSAAHGAAAGALSATREPAQPTVKLVLRMPPG